MDFSMIKARIAEDHSERRRYSRFPVEVDAKVRELGASGVEARVLNISERGFMASSDGRFEVGSRVWLMLPGRDRADEEPQHEQHRHDDGVRSSARQAEEKRWLTLSGRQAALRRGRRRRARPSG